MKENKDIQQLIEEALARNEKRRAHPKDWEHKIQVACVRWFRLQYPQYASLMFAVPNGGWRNETTAAKLKLEGVLPGVSDLILLLHRGESGALLIEMKTEKGRQSDAQKAWQKEVEAQGYKYVVCRSFEEFEKTVTAYVED